MAKNQGNVKYILPQGDEFLKAVTENILYNLRKGKDATIMLTPIVSRAYTIVNETGVLPVRDYSSDTEFV